MTADAEFIRNQLRITCADALELMTEFLDPCAVANRPGEIPGSSRRLRGLCLLPRPASTHCRDHRHAPSPGHLPGRRVDHGKTNRHLPKHARQILKPALSPTPNGRQEPFDAAPRGLPCPPSRRA